MKQASQWHNDLPDDKILAASLRTGSQQAFRHIFDKYGDALYNEACRKTGAVDDAKDLVQEVFMDLFLQRDTLYIEQSFAALLFTMLRNKVISHFRKHVRDERFREILLSLEQAAEVYIADPMALRQLEEAVSVKVAAMPPQMRRIYQLTKEEGYSPRQVADILQLSGQTVRNQLSAALRRIRDGLEGAGFIHFLLLNIHLIYELGTMYCERR